MQELESLKFSNPFADLPEDFFHKQNWTPFDNPKLIHFNKMVQTAIVIGAFEAQSIAIALEKEIMPPRPLTHDLFKTFATRYEIVVKQVIIHKLLDGVFYSSIICEREKIEEIIDARTSDAITLALRFNAPIFTYKNILDKAGIDTETGTKKTTTSKKTEIVSEQILIGEERKEDLSENDFSKHSLKMLKKLLTEAVNNEEYEKAVNIRDEISKRK